MTLEELELRVMAAFPDATVKVEPTIKTIWAEWWRTPLEVEFPGGFFHTCFWNGALKVYTPAPRWDREGITNAQIADRILSVSAHQMIAARRRLHQADAR